MSDHRQHIGARLRFDARKWRGVENLQQSMKAEGFLVPALQAQLASELCDGAFTAEEYMAEGAALTYYRFNMAYDATFIERTPVPSGCQSSLVDVLRKMDKHEQWQRYWGPIEEQKLAESRLLPPGNQKLVLKISEVRKFANKVAKDFGFKAMKGERILFPSSLEKPLLKSGLRGVIGFDGGRSHYDIPFGFDVLCCVTNGPDDAAGITTEPDQLLHGMRLYGRIRHDIDAYGSERTQLLTFSQERWSNLQKIGAYAVVRCFDLFLDSFDKAVSVSPS